MLSLAGRNRNAFTLVEILVTVSIIAILLVVVVGSFSNSKDVAHDQKRVTELKNIQVALELYKQKNGHYPRSISAGGGLDADSRPGSAFSPVRSYYGGQTGWQLLEQELVPEFLGSLPRDPLNGLGGTHLPFCTNCSHYHYSSDVGGTKYMLFTYLSDVITDAAGVNNMGAYYQLRSPQCTAHPNPCWSAAWDRLCKRCQ